ncbi:MAG: mannose-1-phosphate guanylyltransferase, partial [Bacteroidota bacterium]
VEKSTKYDLLSVSCNFDQHKYFNIKNPMEISTQIVIMAGGSGTRFWPYSRDKKPKQFLDVLGTGQSLLQMTVRRFLQVTTIENIWIVTNEKYKDLVSTQVPEISDDQVLLEPAKRNTAPCIAYASYKIRKKDPNSVIVVSPSDHAIFYENDFNDVIRSALSEAIVADKLMTIGIKPNRPETGYGYIQYIENGRDHIHPVKTFTEKPNEELAQKFVESGDFLWNSGIFIWSVASIISAFEKYEVEMAQLFASCSNDFYSEGEQGIIDKIYSQCKSISIDYAIMEKAESVYVLPGDFGWTDLGSWNALHEIREKDHDQNVVEGQVMLYNAKDNYIKAQDHKLTVLEGIEGLLVADFEDVLLICRKEDSTIFRNFTTDIKAQKADKFL